MMNFVAVLQYIFTGPAFYEDANRNDRALFTDNI